jgi:threonine synthase
VAHVEALRCRECGRTYEIAPIYTCEWCFGPLEVAYDYDAITSSISRETIAAGPATIWRYADLLPVEAPSGDATLPVGWTPLVRADHLAAELGLDELWIKDDTRNPTNAFKDRVVAVALAKALEFGIKTLACASTGNLANAVAAHAARAGLHSYVFIPSDLEDAKIVTTSVYGGNVVAINGTYDDVNRLCAEIVSERPWGFANVNLRPFYAEGSKTLAFETAEQLGWEAPDHVVVPVGSGSLLTKIRKGFEDLCTVGLLERAAVRISGAQAAGCAPVANAFAAGTDVVTPVKPSTIAKSLAIGNPADGPFAIDAVRDTGGGFAAVSETEIVDGIRLLARTEGIFGETAAGVTIATLKRLTEEGIVRRDERVVAYVTGHGLKTLDPLAPQVGPTATIAPTLEAFIEAFPESARDAAQAWPDGRDAGAESTRDGED